MGDEMPDRWIGQVIWWSLSHTAVDERLGVFGSQPSRDRTPASERILPMRKFRAALAIAALAAVALLVPSTAQAAPAHQGGATHAVQLGFAWDD